MLADDFSLAPRELFAGWFLFQLVILVAIYASFRRWPEMPVGLAIGAAGVVAAGMTLRDGHWKALRSFYDCHRIWLMGDGCTQHFQRTKDPRR